MGSQSGGNEALQIVFILGFQWATDRDAECLEMREAESNEQHKNIISVLSAAAPTWEFKEIYFVVGNRGFVVEDDAQKA